MTDASEILLADGSRPEDDSATGDSVGRSVDQRRDLAFDRSGDASGDDGDGESGDGGDDARAAPDPDDQIERMVETVDRMLERMDELTE